MDDTDLEKIATLQLAVNHSIYDHIATAYQQTVDLSDDSVAVGIILSAVATNLGMLIAQLPESHRETYLDVAKVIIDKAIVAGAERFDENVYGQVGHA
jgi:hypothetical protein